MSEKEGFDKYRVGTAMSYRSALISRNTVRVIVRELLSRNDNDPAHAEREREDKLVKDLMVG